MQISPSEKSYEKNRLFTTIFEEVCVVGGLHLFLVLMFFLLILLCAPHILAMEAPFDKVLESKNTVQEALTCYQEAQETELDARDQFGNTQLISACKTNQYVLIEDLLKKGASLIAANRKSRNALFYARKKRDLRMLDLFLPYVDEDKKEDFVEEHIFSLIQFENKNLRRTALVVRAVRSNCIHIIDYLLRKRLFSVNNIIDFDGREIENKEQISQEKKWTLVHLACAEGKTKVVTLLLKRAAYIKGGDNQGHTPFHLAVKSGELELVKLFLDQKMVTPQQEDLAGNLPLHLASGRGYVHTVRYLLEAGHNVDVKDRYGRTALHWAAERGYDAVVILLLEWKAQSFKDQKGKTPSDVSRSESMKQLLKESQQEYERLEERRRKSLALELMIRDKTL